jgi:hypothetical protein
MPVSPVSIALYAHHWDIDAAVSELRAYSGLGQMIAGNGAAPNGADPVAAEAPSPDAVPEPIASQLAQIGETIGLIRGAYEAREARLVELQKQLDAARDPAIGRRLADIETQFARQAASFNAVERQLKVDHKNRAQIHEAVALINRKLTQLAHDLKLEKLPVPSRRDPAAG